MPIKESVRVKQAKQAQGRVVMSGITVFCNYDFQTPVTHLMPHPRNPNTHPAAQIRLLANIIKKQGWRAPITISKTSGYIIRGHGRLMAAQLLGLQTVPVEVQQYSSEAAEYADLIADNKIQELSSLNEDILSELAQELKDVDFDLDLAALTLDDVENLAPAQEQINEDEAPEPPVSPISKLGDVWELGKHKLLCGDSSDSASFKMLLGTDVLPVTMVFTDPPYGVSIGDKNKMLNVERGNKKTAAITENIANDTLSPEALKTLLIQVFKNVNTATGNICAIYVCAPQGGSLGVMMLEMMRAAELPVKHILNWIKNSATFSMGRLDYDYQHEPILFTWKKTHKKIMHGKHQTSCWFINKPQSSPLHPTMKPVEVPENAILNSSMPNDICLDPFGGAGSTLIACEKTGRIARLIELDPKYCDVIALRYKKFCEENKRNYSIRLNGKAVEL